MIAQVVAVTYDCGCVRRPLRPECSANCRIGHALALRYDADFRRAAGERPRYLRLTEAAVRLHLAQSTDDLLEELETIIRKIEAGS